MDRSAEIRRLFEEAAALPADERQVWLEGACPDPALREEVATLLRAEAEKGAEVEAALRVARQRSDLPPNDGELDLAGRSLGPYAVLERVGSGGMGVVYRARDTRLDRTVALKVLPEGATRDPGVVRRFLHEARVASSLDHPAICTVYEVVDDRGSELPPLIAMAFVEGETVQARLARGPLPIDQAISIAVRVAEGLAHAHARGIVHRDVKPGNVMLGATGDVKLVDFGLAKARDVDLTRPGVRMGTVSAMSPEQVRGEPVDARTDIWALGALLYAMVVGQPPFRGERPEAVMHAILERDPPPMSALRSGVPVALDRIVAKALAKDPADRYQHVDEIPVDLRSVEPGTGGLAAAGLSSPGAPRRRPGALVAAAITAFAIALLAIAVGPWLSGDEAPPDRTVRFQVPLPDDHTLSSWYQPIALSPDGSRLVFGALGPGRSGLFLRDLDRLQSRFVPATEGAHDPFFSPDGRWIAYFADGKLMKVEAEGGIPQIVCDAPPGNQGASWGPGGEIVLTAGGPTSGLLRVAATGGDPVPLTTPRQDAGEIGHAWPQHLPGGRGLLFTVWAGDGFRTAILARDDTVWRVVHRGDAAARYVPSGHLIFAEMIGAATTPGLLAVPFDLERGEVTGSPMSVLEEPGLAGPNFAVSEDGALAYVAGGSPAWAGLDENALLWVDSAGDPARAVGSTGFYEAPRLSPDGRRVAAATFSPDGTYDTWVFDLDRGTRTRITLQGTINNFPVWSPDGTAVTFNSSRSPPGIYRRSADGTGEAELLVPRERGRPQIPGSWTPDGAALAYTVVGEGGRGDVWILEPGAGKRPLLETGASESSPVFSPSGRFLAWVSDASGRPEVYVGPYPGPGGAQVVSAGGGREPAWDPSGSTLYYRTADAIMAVVMAPPDRPRPGRPRTVLDGRFQTATFGLTNYDVGPDGRFLVVARDSSPSPTRINVVLNWVSELDRAMGRRR